MRLLRQRVAGAALPLPANDLLPAVVTPLVGQTTRAIAAVLNERGIKTARGGRWQSQTVIRLPDRLGL